MALSNDLISQFVKITKDKQDVKKETVVYGTIQKDDSGNDNFVNIDGSNISTPVAKTVVASEGDRVTVMIKNHTATVTGNLSNPSARAIDTLSVENLDVSNAKINQLEAANVTIENRLDAHEGYINDLEADNVNVKDRLTVAEADIERLTAKEVDIETLNAAKAFVDTLQATNADVGYLVSTVSEIDELIFGSASGDVIQSSFSNAVIAQLGDAQIKSAMIDNVSASKITSGDIITNNVRVKSKNGSLIISDETLQISDGTRVRVQVGKDAASDYSINIWDQNGNLMFSKGGITDAAIKEAIIRNDMVSDTANIHASKLDVDSLFEEINGSTNTIKSTQIYVDDKKQTLDVAFKSLTTDMTTQGQTISSQGTQISAIQGQISSKIWQQDIDIAKDALEEQTEILSTRYSTLEQNLNGFKTVVSNTYATKEAFDGLEIGGRNLMIDSSEGYSFTGKSYNNSTHSGTKITCTVEGGKADHYCFVEKYVALTPSELSKEVGTEITFSADVKIVGIINKPQIMFDLRSDDNKTRIVTIRAYADSSITDRWQRISGTATISEVNSDISKALIAVLYDSATLDSTIEYRRVKVERGNKATDWTPAPEDVYSDISELNNRVSNAETVIEQNTHSIDLCATKTEVSNTLKNYSTTTEMNAAIQLKADSITNSVSSTYATISSLNITNTNVESALDAAINAQSDIDNLTIGGRNYASVNNIRRYYGGNLLTPLACWSIEGSKITATEQPLNGPVPGFKIDTNGKYTYMISGYTDLTTVAIYHKCFDVDGNEVQEQITSFITSVNGLFEKRIIVPETTIYFHIGIGSTRISDYYINRLKIEQGTRATDWTPAPEDMATIETVETIDERLISAESSIVQLSNSITTNVTEITNLGTRMSNIEQTSSGLTARLTTAENDILDAAKTATNYLNFSPNGLVVGDMTASTLGKNVLIDTDSVDIRNGTTTLASFGASTIYLGKNNDKSIINLCNGSATMTAVDDTDFRIYSDKRLVMSAYSSMLLDCYRDSTHMTRIAIQSSDPDQSSVVGGVQFTIYQDDIRNTVQMLNNDITLRVTDDVNTTRFAMRENIMRLCSTGSIYINSESAIQIGESSSDTFSVRLGSSYNKAKSIGCYWNDGESHDLITHAANGQNSFFGPSDISITESSSLTSTTNIRGKYIRLYNHAGGGVYLGSSGSTAVTSDRNLKKDIVDIDNKYLDFFDRLRPITYKYDCPENKGHRDHVGFVAQEVEEALTASGLTTEQFAGLVIERDVTLNPNYDSSLSDEENTANETHYETLYSLRYEEFISLLVKKVQSLQEQIDQLRADK